MRILLRIAALGAAIATLVHATALALPSVNDFLYSPAYPWWRHIIFIGINGTLAWLLPRPPSWLVWPYAVLTLQVLFSHGLGGWQNWIRTGRINWLDPVSVVLVPALLLVLVVADHRGPRTQDEGRTKH